MKIINAEKVEKLRRPKRKGILLDTNRAIYNQALDDILKESVSIEEQDIYKIIWTDGTCEETTKAIIKLLKGDK